MSHGDLGAGADVTHASLPLLFQRCHEGLQAAYCLLVQVGRLAGEDGLDLGIDAGFQPAASALFQVTNHEAGAHLVQLPVYVGLEEPMHLPAAEPCRLQRICPPPPEPEGSGPSHVVPLPPGPDREPRAELGSGLGPGGGGS